MPQANDFFPISSAVPLGFPCGLFTANTEKSPDTLRGPGNRERDNLSWEDPSLASFQLGFGFSHLAPLQALHEESRKEGNSTENLARTPVVSSHCQTFSTELRVYLGIILLRGPQKSLTRLCSRQRLTPFPGVAIYHGPQRVLGSLKILFSSNTVSSLDVRGAGDMCK